MAKFDQVGAAEAAEIATKLRLFLEEKSISVNRFARDAGLSQPMVHGVYHGRIRRRTPNVRRLELYIHINSNKTDSPAGVLDLEISAFLQAGGDVSSLRTIIQTVTQGLQRA